MPLVRYEIRSEYELANRDLYRAAPKNDPDAILEGVAMVSLVGIVRQLGDLAEFAADIFHDLQESVMATASRSHDLLLRVGQLEAELPAVEKAVFSKKTNHLQSPGMEWHASIRNDQNHCTQGDLPRFIRSSYEECRGPPMLFMLDKFDIQGAGACLKRYTDPSFFKMEWASSELTKAEKAQHQHKKARRGKKKPRNRKDEAKPAVQFQPRVRYSSLSSIDGMSENTAPISAMVVENEHLGRTAQFSNILEAGSQQSSREGSIVERSPKSVRKLALGKSAMTVGEPELEVVDPKQLVDRQAEDVPRDSMEAPASEAEQYLDAVTTMESETDSERWERRRFYSAERPKKRTEHEHEHETDVFYDDARNANLESETESKFSGELAPIPVAEQVVTDELEEAVASTQRHLGQLEASSSPEPEMVSKPAENAVFSKDLEPLELSKEPVLERPEEQAPVVDTELDEDFEELEHVVVPESDVEDDGDRPVPEMVYNVDRLWELERGESLDREVNPALDTDAGLDEDDVLFDVEVIQVIDAAHNPRTDGQAEDVLKEEAEEVIVQTDEEAEEAEENAEEADEDAEEAKAPAEVEEAETETETETAMVARSLPESDVEAPDRLPLDEKLVDLNSVSEAEGTNGNVARSLDSEKSGEEPYYYLALDKSLSDVSKTFGDAPVPTKLEEEGSGNNVPTASGDDDFESASSQDVFMDPEYQSSSRFSDAGQSDDYRDSAEDQMDSFVQQTSFSSGDWPPETLEPEVESRAVNTLERGEPTLEAVSSQVPATPTSSKSEADWNEEAKDMEDKATSQDSKEEADRDVVVDNINLDAVVDGSPRGAVVDGISKVVVADGSSRDAVVDGSSRDAVVDDSFTRDLVVDTQDVSNGDAFEGADASHEDGAPSPAASSSASPPLPFCPPVGDEDAMSLKLGEFSPLSVKTSSYPNSGASSPKSPVFSALQAPMSPVHSGDHRTGFTTVLSPGSPTSTFDSTFSPTLEEMPPLPPLPPLRWRTLGLSLTEPERSPGFPATMRPPAFPLMRTFPVLSVPDVTEEPVGTRALDAPPEAAEVLEERVEAFPEPTVRTPVQEQAMDSPKNRQAEVDPEVPIPQVQTLEPEVRKMQEPSMDTPVASHSEVQTAKSEEGKASEEEPVSPAAVLEFPDEHTESVQHRQLSKKMLEPDVQAEAPSSYVPAEHPALVGQEVDAGSPDVIPDSPSSDVEMREMELPTSNMDFTEIVQEEHMLPHHGTSTSDTDMQEMVIPAYPPLLERDLPTSSGEELPGAPHSTPRPESSVPQSEVEPSKTLETVPDEVAQKSIEVETEQQPRPDSAKAEELPSEGDDAVVLEPPAAGLPSPSSEAARPETQMVKPELSLYPDARLLPTSGKGSKRDATAPKVPRPKAPKLEVESEVLPASTTTSVPKKDPVDDALIQAISLHDRSKLKKVASDLRPPKAPDDRNVLLEQIRSQSFNLRHTVVPEKKEKKAPQPRIMTSINVAAILEKANAMRQAMAGSDDEDDDDWSDE